MSIVIDMAALLWLLARQVRTRELKESYEVPVILGTAGLFESGAFVLSPSRSRSGDGCSLPAPAGCRGADLG
jgi:hypothetical protein